MQPRDSSSEAEELTLSAMPHADPHVLARAQRQFTIQKAWHNALPTVLYKAASRSLPPSDTITVCTSTIFPPLAIVWNAVVKKCMEDTCDVFIFDCAGTLDPASVPGATVQRFLNVRHATKIDTWIRQTLKNRRIAWICDDDVFPIHAGAITAIVREFAQPKTATVSLRPRTWWHFDMDGTSVQPSGSYCIALDTELFAKEHLSAQPADGNTHPTHTGKKWTRYDTLDKANEELLKREYRCAILPEEERGEYTAGFNGTSIAALLLHKFRSADALLAYMRAVTPAQWQGNVFPRCLQALLAADIIRDLYGHITAKPWPYASLPAKSDMLALRKNAEPYLSPSHQLTDVDTTAQKLHSILSPDT